MAVNPLQARPQRWTQPSRPPPRATSWRNNVLVEGTDVTANPLQARLQRWTQPSRPRASRSATRFLGWAWKSLVLSNRGGATASRQCTRADASFKNMLKARHRLPSAGTQANGHSFSLRGRKRLPPWPLLKVCSTRKLPGTGLMSLRASRRLAILSPPPRTSTGLCRSCSGAANTCWRQQHALRLVTHEATTLFLHQARRDIPCVCKTFGGIFQACCGHSVFCICTAFYTRISLRTTFASCLDKARAWAASL